MRHAPRVHYRRLLDAAAMASKSVRRSWSWARYQGGGDAGAAVAGALPITTGNSYSASGAVGGARRAAAHEPAAKPRARGVVQGHGGGATGAIGSGARGCWPGCRRGVHGFAETAKLLALKESILPNRPTPAHLAAHADRTLATWT